MSLDERITERLSNELHDRLCQKNRVAKQIIDADCCRGDDGFELFALLCELPGLFTARFTSPEDYREGAVFTIKGDRYCGGRNANSTQYCFNQ